MRVNGTELRDVCGKMPTFEKSEFIVEYCVLGGFIGKLYGAVVTARGELGRWEEVKSAGQYGLCR